MRHIGDLALLAVRAFMRHFMPHLGQQPEHPGRPRPPTAPRPPRRRSRNDDVVLRESQPMWLLLPILAVTALFIHKVTASISPSAAVFPLTICAAVWLVLGRLVTEVRGDSLRWHYGWLGWPRWRIDLDDIVAVEPARSRWAEGWGIRVTGEGMLYNSSGTHAVRLKLRDGRRLRLGSQDPQRLVQILRPRIDAA